MKAKRLLAFIFNTCCSAVLFPITGFYLFLMTIGFGYDPLGAIFHFLVTGAAFTTVTWFAIRSMMHFNHARKGRRNRFVTYSIIQAVNNIIWYIIAVAVAVYYIDRYYSLDSFDQLLKPQFVLAFINVGLSIAALVLLFGIRKPAEVPAEV